MSLSRILTRTAQSLCPECRTAQWAALEPGTQGYAELASKTFSFFRSASSGRYSSRTLLRLSDLSEERPGRSLPVILSVGTPYSYDEETEVKRGGLIGMCVWWPEETGRCLIAVTKSARRKKVATTFVIFTTEYLSHYGDPSFWVGRNNIVAQQFLLSQQFLPSAINSNGAVQYGRRTPEEGEEMVTAATPRPARLNIAAAIPEDEPVHWLHDATPASDYYAEPW